MLNILDIFISLDFFLLLSAMFIFDSQHELRPNNLRNLQETESVVTEVGKTFDQSRKRSLR